MRLRWIDFQFSWKAQKWYESSPLKIQNVIYIIQFHVVLNKLKEKDTLRKRFACFNFTWRHTVFAICDVIVTYKNRHGSLEGRPIKLRMKTANWDCNWNWTELSPSLSLSLSLKTMKTWSYSYNLCATRWSIFTSWKWRFKLLLSLATFPCF